LRHRGRTPLTKFAAQVEPQEKKKTPKGRAKKRITYTRRFVNVTMTGGKRKVSQTICHSLYGMAVNADHGIDEPQPYLINGQAIMGLERDRTD
jgi:small subunit ribosomal protein S30e